MEQMLSTGDIARLVGVPRHRIEYAVRSGYLGDSKTRFLGRRCFDSDDVRRIAIYFENKKKAKENND